MPVDERDEPAGMAVHIGGGYEVLDDCEAVEIRIGLVLLDPVPVVLHRVDVLGLPDVPDEEPSPTPDRDMVSPGLPGRVA